MKLASFLEQTMHHCEDSTAHLLKALNIKFTRSYLQKELVEHPNYPSLAAIADVIGMFYDVACAPIKIPIRDYQQSSDFRLPFLAQIQPKEGGQEVFAVVTHCTDEVVTLYNPVTRQEERYTSVSFRELYRGLILVVEAGAKKQEDQYEKHLEKQRQSNGYNFFAIIGLPVITVVIVAFYYWVHPAISSVAPILFTILTLTGSVLTAVLLWHEIDEYNPVVRQICQNTARVNCSAVLNSAASKIKGLSWSSLGFVYFTGMLLALLSSNIAPGSLGIAAWMSLFSTPYILFSLYYQWRVVRQWCVLCLMVQAILLLLLFTAFAGDFYSIPLWTVLSVNPFAAFMVSFLFVFTVIIILMPALQKVKGSRQKAIELQRIKHTPQIFVALLAKQKRMIKSADGLGISIGNPNSVFKLIKVCNPYCGPCAKAHPIMEELVNSNEEVSMQIIFTATEKENDIRREPVMHLMAIAAKGEETLTKKALDDWYLADKKDYASFAAQYQLSEQMPLQTEKLRAMNEWCDAVQISFTPTFFVCLDNKDEDPKFYQLPDMYTVADLKYFFTT